MPVPDYIKFIIDFENAGVTDEDIASTLSSITANPIESKVARAYFRDSEWWQQTPIGFEGKLQLAYDASNQSAANLKVLKRLWDAAFSNSVDDCETTLIRNKQGKVRKSQPAEPLFKVLGRLVNRGEVETSEVDGFYALGGGLLFPALTEADIAASRAAYQAEQVELARVQSIDSFQAMLENTWIEVAKTDGMTTAEQLRALIKAGL